MNASNALPPDAESWLTEHPDLSLANLERPWRLSSGADPLALAPSPDPARIRAIRTALAQAAPSGPASLRLAGRLRRTTWLATAAVVAALLAVGLGWRFTPVTITVPPGTSTTTTLPDGSIVQLHSGTMLQHPRTFGSDTRTVKLEGEAFFEVARTGAPFSIETFNATVTVLGTTFNVHAWPEPEGGTVVSVVSGMVEVAPRSTAASAVRLEAGQRSLVNDAARPPSPPTSARLDEVTAWRNGGFVFYDRPHGAIFDEIERRFGVQIQASETIRERLRTFSRQQVPSIEILLNDVCQPAGLRFRRVADGYEIFEASPATR